MHIDHVVLWVDRPTESLEFYVNVIGLTPVRTQEYEAGTAPFPSVRLNDATIIDLMAKEMLPGVREFTGARHTGGSPINHLCLCLDPADYAALAGRLQSAGVELVPGSEASYGAQGEAVSSEYFCDPDGNVIEIRHYG